MINKESNLMKFISYLLLYEGFFLAFSHLMIILSNDTTDKAFQRLTVSIICFGFYGIINKLDKLK